MLMRRKHTMMLSVSGASPLCTAMYCLPAVPEKLWGRGCGLQGVSTLARWSRRMILALSVRRSPVIQTILQFHDSHLQAWGKIHRCEQDSNLRRETLLDFESNAFTSRPSQHPCPMPRAQPSLWGSPNTHSAQREGLYRACCAHIALGLLCVCGLLAVPVPSSACDSAAPKPQ